MTKLLEQINTAPRTIKKLGEVFEIIDGDRGTNYPSKSEFTKKGYCVFLNTKNVPSQGFDFANVDFISRERDELLRKGKLERNDIVMTTRGTIGNVAHFSNDVPFDCMRINSGMVILRSKPEVDRSYLYTLIKSSVFNAQLKNTSSGSAQPQLPIKDLKEIELDLPDLTTQKKIAEIIGAYDEKIENNNFIIKKLEATAQALFNEWFVNFRFPGHEKIKFVDSEMGEIPEGWEIKKVSDVSDLNKGVSYTSNEINTDNIGTALINLGNFKRGGGFNLNGTKYYTGDFKDSHLVKPGQILIAMTDLTSNREVIGHPARLPGNFKKAVISLDVCSLVPKKDIYNEFLYSLMLRRDFSKLMASCASGTNVSHLSKTHIEGYEFIMPTEKLLTIFNNFVQALFNKQALVENENQMLNSTKERLLAKLI